MKSLLATNNNVGVTLLVCIIFKSISHVILYSWDDAFPICGHVNEKNIVVKIPSEEKMRYFACKAITLLKFHALNFLSLAYT